MVIEFPGESSEYRAARDRLLEGEVELRRLTEAVHRTLDGQPGIDSGAFYRLRSAGVMAGDTATEIRPRCQLYARCLRRHLA